MQDLTRLFLEIHSRHKNKAPNCTHFGGLSTKRKRSIMILSFLIFSKILTFAKDGGITVKKTIGFLAAVLMTAVLLTACSARTPISADDFQKKAESAGFQVEQNNSYTDATSLVASKEDSSTQITFTVFSTSSTAEQQYVSLKKDLTVTDEKSLIDSSAYNKYVAQNGEMYYTLIRMDNTLLNCKGTTAEKDEIDDFVKDIQY